MTLASVEPIQVRLTYQQMMLVYGNARACSMGGKSNVRTGTDRKGNLRPDQFAGQLGEAAASILLFGTIDRYLRTRALRNLTPHKGDDGIDLIGTNVDVKSTSLRERDYTRLNLLVPKREHKADRVYLCTFAECNRDATKFSGNVIVCGWMHTDDITGDYLDADPRFEAGRYAVPVPHLHPPQTFREAVSFG